MDDKARIIDKAKKCGIDVIGFTDCSPFYETAEILKDRESRGFLSGFEERDIKKRVEPCLLMEGCRTIISAGISYNVCPDEVSHKKNYRHRSTISRASWGEDYHGVLRGKLEVLAAFIEECFNGKAAVHVDTGPLIEREVARRAGVGYIGKNCSLINPEFGSYIFIGEILTDIYIEPDEPLDEGCGNCDICVRACPAGALCSPYTLNAKKCISYITQSREAVFDSWDIMGNSIYGCDVCQNACPKNRDVRTSNHGEFTPHEWNSYPDAVDILEMDNNEFKNTFKKTSSGWRGKKNLQRNAIIAMGNSGSRDTAAYIKRMLGDDRRDIREASIYALFKLLGRDSVPVLNEQLEKEDDDRIRDMIHRLLRGL